MSSSGSPPFGSQTEVAETSQEMLPEEDGRGGEIHGAGGQSASTSRAHDRAPPRPSQGRRRGGGGHTASQRAPDSDGEEAGFINIDLLIDEVREREPLWNMADRRHADTIVTRRLWDEVCHAAVEGWGELNSRGQKKQRDKLQKRWRSIRDRFKKELNQEMQAPSGSGGRRSKYRYFRALSFLRTTMVCRSYVTASKMLLLCRGLQRVTANQRDGAINTEKVKELVAALCASMERKFQRMEFNTILSETTLLDPRFKKLTFSDNRAVDEALQRITAAARCSLTSQPPPSGGPEDEVGAGAPQVQQP
ncbi:uncharacterized protein LOC142310598 [Anomaloglossus baeobatrachus]|uniref:uncharacterized protein LOC142310598 n=1 Tax=Anomaloglossus baeobatrachus TaxID=238106 RepID=UPI003F500833